MVSEIRLKLNPITAHLQYAVPLAHGQLLVSHRGRGEHRVCLKGFDEMVVKAYSGQPGWIVGKLNFPNYLVVDRKGFILVADSKNNHILLLSPSLAFIRVLLIGSSLRELRYSSRLHLDEVLGRLYFGEYMSLGGRVSVFKVNDLCQY